MRALLLVLILFAPQDRGKATAQKWKISIEAKEKVGRPGRPIRVRFTVENPTDRTMDLAEPEDYTDGLQITDPDGKIIKESEHTKNIKRIIRADGHGFVGRTVDISSVLKVPAEKEGVYTLRWKFGESVSKPIQILVFRDYIAEIVTNLGTITVEFYPELAPRHVRRFINLARKGFYKGSKFHRVISGFMMQGGAPADPRNRVKESLKAEFSESNHVFGTLSMARSGNPDSAKTQFFISFDRVAHLDGKYTVFGQVIDGENVVKKVEKLETDHSPCKGCGMRLPVGPQRRHCGVQGHHEDAPLKDVVISEIKIKERKEED